jgi:lipid A 3-O-deacylase
MFRDALLKVHSPARWICILVSLFVGGAVASASAQSSGSRAFSLTQENDFWAGTDRHYTHGIKLAYGLGGDQAPAWSERLSAHLPAVGFEQQSNIITFSVGQYIYTPANVRIATLNSFDRPYAGWLYAGITLQREGRTARGRTIWETWGFDLGIVGPGALAEPTQDFIHELSSSAKPLGWHHQLRNEPGLALKYQRTYRYACTHDSGWGLDFLPHGGVSAGNISTDARLGATLRAGFRLPNELGPQNNDSLAVATSSADGDRPFSAYAFGGVEGRAVAYSVFFNGNLWDNSHQISKEPGVADFKGGFVLGWRCCEAAFSLTLRTREFVGQASRNTFGSVALRVWF